MLNNCSAAVNMIARISRQMIACISRLMIARISRQLIARISRQMIARILRQMITRNKRSLLRAKRPLHHDTLYYVISARPSNKGCPCQENKGCPRHLKQIVRRIFRPNISHGLFKKKIQWAIQHHNGHTHFSEPTREPNNSSSSSTSETSRYNIWNGLRDQFRIHTFQWKWINKKSPPSH